LTVLPSLSRPTEPAGSRLPGFPIRRCMLPELAPVGWFGSGAEKPTGGSL